MLDKAIVIRTLQGQAEVLRERYHIEKMGLFGSFSRGQQTHKSEHDYLGINPEEVWQIIKS